MHLLWPTFNGMTISGMTLKYTDKDMQYINSMLKILGIII